MKLPTINYKQLAISNRRKGVTLIELLVVITIIAILAAVVMLALNPAELARKGRDSTRLSDMENLRKTFDIIIAQGGQGSTTEPNTGGLTRRSDTSGTAAQRRACTLTTNSWLDGGFDYCDYLPVLPVDPKNDNTNHYEFRAQASGYEIRCTFESSANQTKYYPYSADGGDDAGWYEVGTDLTIL